MELFFECDGWLLDGWLLWPLYGFLWQPTSDPPRTPLPPSVGGRVGTGREDRGTSGRIVSSHILRLEIRQRGRHPLPPSEVVPRSRQRAPRQRPTRPRLRLRFAEVVVGLGEGGHSSGITWNLISPSTSITASSTPSPINYQEGHPDNPAWGDACLPLTPDGHRSNPHLHNLM
jgi:hypothetical protein